MRIYLCFKCKNMLLLCVFADGHPHQEDLCWRTVCVNDSGWSQGIFQPVWKGRFWASSTSPSSSLPPSMIKNKTSPDRKWPQASPVLLPPSGNVIPLKWAVFTAKKNMCWSLCCNVLFNYIKTVDAKWRHLYYHYGIYIYMLPPYMDY